MSIQLTDISKRFGDALVVDKMSLSISDGELFVLLGGSGSGKSTILRMIAGLLNPDQGSVFISGREVTQLPPQARNTGLVFQNYSLFRHMTVADNIEFGLRIRGIDVVRRRRKAEELLDLVGLGGLGERFPRQLSGGQQQRIALARALAYEPSVLLLDEPFGALDVRIRAQLRESLKDIQRHLKITTILVTHDQDEAFELGDRIAVLETGHLIEVGTPEQLYHRPKTEIVASFIGGGNVLVGRAKEGRISLGQVTLPFPKEAPPHEDGTPVRILFRPEDMVQQVDEFWVEHPVHPLGKGKFLKRRFAGAQQRLRFELEGLKGARSVTPSAAQGQRFAHIEVVEPSTSNAIFKVPHEDELRWIGAHRFHVLEPAGFKILACIDGSENDPALLDLSAHIAKGGRGHLTLLRIGRSSEKPVVLKNQVDGHLRRLEPQGYPVRSLVRIGSRFQQILYETQEGSAETVVVHRPRALASKYPILGNTVTRLLHVAQAPVLIAQPGRAEIKTILVGTAGGEPGRHNVLISGRLARQTGAVVHVFHCLSTEATEEDQARIERHLSNAVATLDALGVQCSSSFGRGEVVQAVLDEAQTRNADLISIGAPSPDYSPFFGATDVSTEMCLRVTNKHILLVPLPR